MKNILVAVDFSTYSERAARQAVTLFADSKHFQFVYVLPLTYADLWSLPSIQNMKEIREKSEKKMDELIKSLNMPSESTAEYGILEGDPAERIIGLANSGKYDIVVMGHRGHSLVGDLLVGSTVMKVMSKAKIPVTVIK